MKTFRKKLLEKFPTKAQSAMEYLMTYGWAILIIAVVLGALFQLGVFNANNFAPKAPPGSCQVFRPNGPGTTSFINLEGICTGEIPQYVASFNPDGSTATAAYINVPEIIPIDYSTFSYFAWIYPTSSGGGQCCRRVLATSAGDSGAIEVSTGGSTYIMINGYNTGGWLNVNSYFPLNTWNFVGATYNGSAYNVYLNGKLVWSKNVGTLSGYATPGNLQIALTTAYGIVGNQFFGNIANVQVYNMSLSASQIQALYQEGIGGAPIDLQNLVGWWPLNGNANDYSGNGDNGQINGGVTFVSNWWSGYTPP